MKAVVTGAAGFIGSALCVKLLDQGDDVVGVDSFLDSYPREIKQDRIDSIAPRQGFTFIEGNIARLDLATLFDEVDCVFHLAAQAGVRSSWGERFEVYTESNILGTQRVLEAARKSGVGRVVYSSSSSVYGDAETMPTPEGDPLRPVSPYAVSKVAGEHLCSMYLKSFGVHTVILRYFTVYGPRPRPDQAVCLFTRALIDGQEIAVFGDGEQLRGMTYVDDVVHANLLAQSGDCVGEVMNIGGGTSTTVNELIQLLESITGKQAKVRFGDTVEGDTRHTLADITRAGEVLGWRPQMDLEEGLRRSVASIEDYYYPAQRKGGQA